MGLGRLDTVIVQFESSSGKFFLVFPCCVSRVGKNLRRSNHSFKEVISSVKIRSSETSRRGGLGSPRTTAPQGMKERSRNIHNGNKFNLPVLPSLEPFFSSSARILISHFNRQTNSISPSRADQIEICTGVLMVNRTPVVQFFPQPWPSSTRLSNVSLVLRTKDVCVCFDFH